MDGFTRLFNAPRVGQTNKEARGGWGRRKSAGKEDESDQRVISSRVEPQLSVRLKQWEDGGGGGLGGGKIPRRQQASIDGQFCALQTCLHSMRDHFEDVDQIRESLAHFAICCQML